MENTIKQWVDKLQLLPHPEGGTWLERQVRLLASLGEPVTLLTRHGSHLALADRLAEQGIRVLQPIREPQPQRGPLLALQSLLECYPDARILLCPVDMPWLQQVAWITIFGLMLFVAIVGNALVAWIVLGRSLHIFHFAFD